MSDYEIITLLRDFAELGVTLFISFISLITFLDKRYKKDDK